MRSLREHSTCLDVTLLSFSRQCKQFKFELSKIRLYCAKLVSSAAVHPIKGKGSE